MPILVNNLFMALTTSDFSPNVYSSKVCSEKILKVLSSAIRIVGHSHEAEGDLNKAYSV